MTGPHPVDHRELLQGRGRLVEELPGGPSLWPAVSLAVFFTGWLVAVGLVFAAGRAPEQLPWMEWVFPLLACLAALAALSHRLPLQNVVAIGALLLLFSAAIVGCGAASGIPFGMIHFTDRLGPKLFGKLPLAMPLWWVAILVTSRETARLILQPWRRKRYYGFRIMGLAALLAVVVDLSLEPFAVSLKQYWIWQTTEHTLCWYSAPWANFVGWSASTVVLLGFCSPWFIRKHPWHPPSRFQAAIVWGLLNLYFVAGNALRSEWLAVMAGGGMSALALFMAWRGYECDPNQSVTPSVPSRADTPGPIASPPRHRP